MHVLIYENVVWKTQAILRIRSSSKNLAGRALNTRIWCTLWMRRVIDTRNAQLLELSLLSMPSWVLLETLFRTQVSSTGMATSFSLYLTSVYLFVLLGMIMSDARQEFTLLPPPFPEFKDDYEKAISALKALCAVTPGASQRRNAMIVQHHGVETIRFSYNMFKHKVRA